ncbi:MAG: rhomboid family intramembrane serine protease [Actinomycetota bacterium]
MITGTSLIPIRDENPTASFPIVTIGLIIANVLVTFLLTPSFGQERNCRNTECVAQQCSLAQFFYKWGVVPDEVADGEQLGGGLGPDCPSAFLEPKSILLSLITSIFIHGGFLHLAGNMLFLWVFGNNIEDRLGKPKFLLFYLVTGLAATFAHIAFNTGSQVPTVGASGAVSGLLGAYIVLFPRAKVDSVVPIPILFFLIGRIRLPAYVVLGMWFVSQFFIGSGQQPEGGGVAWIAHVGGFLAGMVLIFVFGGWRKPDRSALSYSY